MSTATRRTLLWIALILPTFTRWALGGLGRLLLQAPPAHEIDTAYAELVAHLGREANEVERWAQSLEFDSCDKEARS